MYSNVWVGLAALSFTLLSLYPLPDWSLNYPLLVFFFTVAAYNYMRLVQISTYKEEGVLTQKFWLKQHFIQASFFTILFSGLGTYFFFRMFSWHFVSLMLVPALIALAYPVGFTYPFRSFTSLRTIPGLKVVLIAGCWSYTTALLPVLIYNDEIQNHQVLEFIFRGLLIIALVIPFDIRDQGRDDPGLGTLPQLVGARKARLLALFFTLIYALWKTFLFSSEILDRGAFLIWMGGLGFCACLLSQAHRNRSELYSGFWIEGVPVLIALIMTLYYYH